MKLADILLHSEFEKFTCGQVSSLYNRSIVPIDLFISLENAINEIVSTGVPRLIAFDHNVLPIGVLSQSRIVATVSPLLINTSFALTPISELKVGLKYTTSFHDSDTLSTVFNHLQNRNLNSVPVLGRDMFVMGMVSTSDLRKVETLDSLAGGADCEVVLRDFLEPTIEKMKKLGVQYPVMATRQSPLSEVIANFQLYKIRQIFICEEKVADGERFKYKAVVGVVTLCDILQLVQKHFIDQQPLPSTHKHVKKESMSKSSSKKSSKHKDHSRRKEPNPVANSI